MNRAAYCAMFAGLLASSLTYAQVAPTFRSSTDLVVVDLIAVDSKGRFIDDLRAGEIEVKHNGKPQPVQVLQLMEAGPFTVAPRAPVARSGQPETASGGPDGGALEPRRDVRRVAIVIDKPSLSVDAVPRVRDAIAAMLEQLPSDVPTLIALVDPDLTIVQDFTRDQRVLKEAIGRLTPNVDATAGSGAVYNAVDRICSSKDTARVIEAALEAGADMIRDTELRSANTAGGVVTLANLLARVPGRKHLVLYSSGYPIEPVADAVDAAAAAASSCTSIDAMALRRRASEALGGLRSQAVANDMSRMIAAANRAQTSLYTLDPAGLTTTAINDLVSVFRSAVQDALAYYLVGYYLPTGDAKKGETVKVSLSVKRKGVSIRYRYDYATQDHTVPFTK